MKCTEIVIQDHVILRRALEILDTLVRKMERGERIEIADALTVLKFIRLFGVEYHQTIEEKILFPALLSAAPQESPARHMMFEHADHRTLLGAIDVALSQRKGREFVKSARTLIVLLRNHFDREDQFLRTFEAATLSKEADDAVFGEITRSRKPPENYTHFSALERKYFPRPQRSPLDASRPAYGPRSANFEH
jgi:hemerythrin-like domain-containing protein